MGQTISGMPAEYERPISRAKARALCGMYPLPAVGYETCVAFARDKTYRDFSYRLQVGNYGGRFAVTCCNARADSWPSIFGVKL